MTAIPSSALLGQFACDITPAGQAVFGLNTRLFPPITHRYKHVYGNNPDHQSLKRARTSILHFRAVHYYL